MTPPAEAHQDKRREHLPYCDSHTEYPCKSASASLGNLCFGIFGIVKEHGENGASLYLRGWIRVVDNVATNLRRCLTEDNCKQYALEQPKPARDGVISLNQK
jgi:hypothetical protein